MSVTVTKTRTDIHVNVGDSQTKDMHSLFQ